MSSPPPIPRIQAVIDECLPLLRALLTDLANQLVIEDPDGLVAAWQTRLADYPRELETALIRKHLGSLRYWRKDYHLENKVARRDPVFLAGISARLVHDVMQVLFALNHTYYVGDGANLIYAENFAIRPTNLAPRITAALYPGYDDDAFARQFSTLAALIDDIETLANSHCRTLNPAQRICSRV